MVPKCITRHLVHFSHVQGVSPSKCTERGRPFVCVGNFFPPLPCLRLKHHVVHLLQSLRYAFNAVVCRVAQQVQH
jgi:hypothetical protein